MQDLACLILPNLLSVLSDLHAQMVIDAGGLTANTDAHGALLLAILVRRPDGFQLVRVVDGLSVVEGLVLLEVPSAGDDLALASVQHLCDFNWQIATT